jgi:hypothetical protein
MKPFWGTRETGRKQMGGKPAANNVATKAPGGSHEPFNSLGDRATHLKIVVVALVAGITVAGLAISARTSSDYAQTAHVIKAGKAIAVTSSETSMVR